MGGVVLSRSHMSHCQCGTISATHYQLCASASPGVSACITKHLQRGWSTTGWSNLGMCPHCPLAVHTVSFHFSHSQWQQAMAEMAVTRHGLTLALPSNSHLLQNPRGGTGHKASAADLHGPHLYIPAQILCCSCQISCSVAFFFRRLHWRILPLGL